MNILGIYECYPSTAALLKDGEIIACCSEERYTRIKNDEAFPRNSIDYCLSEGSISAKDLDQIVLVGNENDRYEQFLSKGTWSIDDYVKEQREYWYPKLYQKKTPNLLKIFAEKVDYDKYPGKQFWNDVISGRVEFNSARILRISEYLNTSKDIVEFCDHHQTHGAYAYFASPFAGEEALIITIDGFGDGLNATVSTTDGHTITQKFKTDQLFIGRLYRYMTLVLGMKPNEHEYKVMGLAPYASNKTLEKPLSILRNTLEVDGISFKWRMKPQDLYFYFRDQFEGCRFDGIAGSLQKYTEEILVTWITNLIKKFDIHTLVISGGVAMNIKAMGCIADIPEVKKLFVAGSGSDESLAIGSCFLNYHKNIQQTQTKKSSIKPLNTMYLGPAQTERDLQEAIHKYNLKEQYSVIENFENQSIVDELVKGKIIGRCAGRMEFGARALGNRSIIADPRNNKIIRRINEAIKNRDFWMPFAPTILFEYQDKYLENPKKIRSPFMTIGFKTKETTRDEIIATLHPYDFTARPQILERNQNPEYYEIIHTFFERTGVPVLLNTSFNLHGYPIVRTYDDAISVFENSKLDAVILGNAFIYK